MKERYYLIRIVDADTGEGLIEGNTVFNDESEAIEAGRNLRQYVWHTARVETVVFSRDDDRQLETITVLSELTIR